MPGQEAQEPLVWERVEWRQGDGQYVFLVERGGLHATLKAPHGHLTLPVIAWEGLLDALGAARKTKSRSERNLPARTGARWSESESGELMQAFKAGRTIAQLARAHNRTVYGIETQLDRLGLWDRVKRRPIGAALPTDSGPSRHRPPPLEGDAWRSEIPAPASGGRLSDQPG
jgi:hypothetical protein